MKPASNQASVKRRGPVPARIMWPRLVLIVVVIALLAIGLVMVYSASSITAMNEGLDATYYLSKQLVFIAAGIVAIIFCILIPYRWWRSRFSWAPWAIVVLLLIYTAVAGFSGDSGAQRWISLGPLGTFQPSELAKIAVTLVFASLLSRFREGELTFIKFLVLSLLSILVPSVLVIFQPDLGTTIIVFIVMLSVLWFGEADLRIIIALIVSVAAVALIAILVAPWRFERVLVLFDPWSDPLGKGYQILNSFEAFGSGGLFGVGIGLSRSKYLYLPYAHTDFIFSIIGEELGLVGATAVIALFVLFIYAGLRIAREAPTMFCRMLAGTATVAIGFQAFLNIACTMGIFPVTGKPLPFISAGGSSMLATLILVGLILAVSFQSNVMDRNSARRLDFEIIDGGNEDAPPFDDRWSQTRRAAERSNTAHATAQVRAGRSFNEKRERRETHREQENDRTARERKKR